MHLRAAVCCALGLAAGASGSALAADILVGAAVSLREPLLAIGDAWKDERPELDTDFVFGASSAIAAQIRAGAPIDVFLSADARLVDDLETLGLAAPEATFALASNRLVVIGRRSSGSDSPVGEILASGEQRIAIPGPQVPVGRYAREWLAATGLLDALGGRLVQTEHASATLAAVELELADLAIVYATDASRAHEARVLYEIPAAEQPDIAYAAALTTRRGASPDGPAQAFLAFLQTDRSRALLEQAGFLVRRSP